MGTRLRLHARRSLLLASLLALGAAPACGDDGGSGAGAGGASAGTTSASSGAGASSGTSSGTSTGGGGAEAGFPLNGLCTEDAWCWAEPTPQGVSLVSVDGLAANDVWAVGEGGVALHFDGQGWSFYDTKTQEDLIRVVATPSGAYALSKTGRVYRETGAVWALHAEAPENLGLIEALGLWVSPAGVAWLSGTHGNVWRHEGGTWKHVDLKGALGDLVNRDVFDVDGSADDDVWLVTQGDMVHFDGSTFTEFSSSDAGAWVDVDVRGKNRAWAVQRTGAVALWNGAAWTKADYAEPKFGEEIRASSVCATPDGGAWMVGSSSEGGGGGGYLVRFEADGSRGGVFGNPAFRSDLGPLAVWSDAASFARYVGTRGVTGETTGSGLTTNVERLHLSEFYAAAPDDVWSVSPLGEVWHWDGSAWARSEDRFAHFVDGAASNDVWLSGASTPEHFDGMTWAKVKLPDGQQLGRVFALGDGRALAGVNGTDGDVVLLDAKGGTATPLPPAPGSVRLVSGPRRADAVGLWVAGTRKTDKGNQDYFARFDGATWKSIDLPPNSGSIGAFTAVDETHVWGGGIEGHAFFYDGSTFQFIELFAPGADVRNAHFAAHARGPADVWMAHGGDVFHWDGAAWTFERVGNTNISAFVEVGDLLCARGSGVTCKRL